MEKTIKSNFIPQQLLYFIAGWRCCQQFACTFRKSDHIIIISCARSLGLHSQHILKNGQSYVKVFKRSCSHYLEEPKSLILSRPTVIELCKILPILTGRDELQSISFEYISQHSYVKILTRDMATVALSSPKEHIEAKEECIFLRNIPSYPWCSDVLQCINENRVVVFEADHSINKSLLLPIIILKQAESSKSNLNIICIETESILATYNSERFAEYLGEKVGETVGIQIFQHTRISSATHAIFTTAQYFLRSLIDENKTGNSYKHVSHFVVSDVHLHAPYTDILLYELKKALRVHQQLRIILLSQFCDTSQFLNFFGEGSHFGIEQSCLGDLRIFYLDDIKRCLASAGINNRPQMHGKKPHIFINKTLRHEQVDKCLQAYEELGTDMAFRPFLYSVNYELIPVNYQHSQTGKTAVNIASQLSNANHLRLLLFMGANPYIADNQHENAINKAIMKGNAECMEILNNYSLHDFVVKNAKPEFIDFDVIVDIMYLICYNAEFTPGNVLIILPTYYHMIKLNYILLSHFLTSNLPEFSVALLHENMDEKYLALLVNTYNDTLKIVLATDLVQSLSLPISFKYLIDTAREKTTIYDYMSNSSEDRYEWIAKDCLLRRQLILNAKAAVNRHCFLLMTKETYQILTNTNEPQIQRMHLDKICLIAKLLSPYTSISEYLTNIIATPPLINVHQTVQFLKKIDVLDESEEVSWLGCRLIDIPVPCQLGRTLIFGILLQCLDPVLIIVCSLCTTDPLAIPLNEDIDYLWDKYTIYIQNRIKSERTRLADDNFSDYLVFVRLFQEWENRLKNDSTSLYLTDEYDFVLNGLMEQLNYNRSRIVNALRAAHLVHKQGPFTIYSVNNKSDNWPIVKAALTGGMYPNICAVDQKQKCFKSAHSISSHLHASSVLRDFFEPLNKSVQNVRTPWIVCTKQKSNIKYASAVAPLAVAMFAGSTKLGLGEITEIEFRTDNTNIHFFLDEWICMVVSKSDFELVMKTRQHFFRIYQYILKYCNEHEKFRSDVPIITQYLLLLETLSKTFENEERATGFKNVPHIGFKPFLKFPNEYLMSVNSHFIRNPQLDDKTLNFLNHSERHFFLLYTEENSVNFYKKSHALYIENLIGKFVRPIKSPTKHIYVILYTKNPDIMQSICQANIQRGEFILKEYFRNAVPVSEILDSCAAFNLKLPNFDGRFGSFLIDKRIGKLIMELFAFRHHWIQK